MKVKVYAKCPNCKDTKLVEYNPAMGLWCLFPIVGWIVFMVYEYKYKAKAFACPKCGCQMQTVGQGDLNVTKVDDKKPVEVKETKAKTKSVKTTKQPKKTKKTQK